MPYVEYVELLSMSFTRTMHVHDASRYTVPVHMCTLPMRVGHVEQMSQISQSSRTTYSTVESNIKSEHNLHLACEDSPQRAFFLALSLVLVLPS